MAKEILIADSDKAVQEKFQKILGTTDYHLVFSESGEDVLLRVKLFKPDLIIAGRALSDKSGYELCEAIKGDPGFRSIPFILLLDAEEISDEDRKHLKPDGILPKPLHERNVLDMVDRLLENPKPKGEGISGKKMELETFGDMGEERFESSESGGKEEEDVIDLFEVVEEAESKMSIDDFVVPEKAEPFGEMTSLDSWEKLGEEEKIAAEEGFTLSLEGVEEEPKDLPFKTKEEVPPQKEAQEEEFFEKIELEDILEKVGKIERPLGGEEPSERELKAFREERVPVREPQEKPFEFEEFETALKKGVEAELSREEPPKEEALEPFSFEEVKEEILEERPTPEIPIEERAVRLEEEEFPEELLEDRLEEEVLKEEEELKEEELKEEKLFEEEELLEEGELPEEELLGEEKPLEEEALEVVGESKEKEADLFEGLEVSKLSGEEQRIIEEAAEMRAKKAEAIEAPRVFEKEFPRPLRRMDQHVEELISEKVQGMLEDLVSKHVPEMTKDLVHLTLERIEKMVREIVPELAEKMIEEEIKRLEKGEKE